MSAVAMDVCVQSGNARVLMAEAWSYRRPVAVAVRAAGLSRQVLTPVSASVRATLGPDVPSHRPAVAEIARAVRLLKLVLSPSFAGDGAVPESVRPSHRPAVDVGVGAARVTRSVLSTLLSSAAARFGSTGISPRVGPPPNLPIEVTPSRYALSRTSSGR